MTTDPMIIAGAVVLVIAAIASGVVQIINAKAAADDRREAKIARDRLLVMADINDGKTNKIVEQGVAIHTLTNSNLSKVTADLATATVTIQNLERMIANLTKAKDVADNLANSTTSNQPNVPSVPIPIPIQIVDDKK